MLFDIYAGGQLIGRVLANGYREDLKAAGLGGGHHAFTFTPPAAAPRSHTQTRQAAPRPMSKCIDAQRADDRHCEERSDEAMQGRASALDCFASLQ